ncbi:hypothetical protein CKA32_001580 [Geitlerinema sp. FC II]|nr:hypothetical protein CKA32_001580 [Geitlerinema sp. FC II]
MRSPLQLSLFLFSVSFPLTHHHLRHRLSLSSQIPGISKMPGISDNHLPI